MQQGSLKKLNAIDLFAGGGGLTVGLKRAGFKVIAAVENEKNARDTYVANHAEIHMFYRDIRDVSGAELLSLSPNGEIDLLSGCPPCQGFSTLTNKCKNGDPRNELILEMTRLIKETLPHAVMMENVPGLAKKGKPLFEEFLNTLDNLGYIYQYDILQVANFGIPQNRKRLVFVAGLGFQIKLPSPTHSMDPTDGLESWRTVANTIKEMPEPITLSQALKKNKPKSFNWHVVRDISKITKERLKKTTPGSSRAILPQKLRPECHKNSDKGFQNVYGRMTWDDIAPTITRGCTTLSMGRFGHPDRDRTISVREAALLQTFPEDYVFDTSFINYACEIIGNALPCDFAESLAKRCHDAILAHA